MLSRAPLLPVTLALAACTVGSGSGQVDLTVSLEACELRDRALSLEPTFFAAQAIGDATLVRVQHGGQTETFSDGITLRVADASDVARNHLGTPLEVGLGDDPLAHAFPVSFTVFLNETCSEAGSASLPAVSGTATFDAIYAPNVDDGARLVEGHFDVVLADPEAPERDHGTASGWFRFFYARGRPAQPFP